MLTIDVIPVCRSSVVTYDVALHTMRVEVEFSGLLAPVTVAHIHCCVSPSAALPTAGVATPVPTFPGFPAGEIRGFLVPEPGALALLGLALAGLALRRRAPQ